MIAWADAAGVFTIIVVIECLALVLIARRRTRYAGRRASQAETIALHARWQEGPLAVALLVIALLTGASPLFATDSQRVLILGVAIAMIRASVFTIATFLLAWYWKVRATWR